MFYSPKEPSVVFEPIPAIVTFSEYKVGAVYEVILAFILLSTLLVCLSISLSVSLPVSLSICLPVSLLVYLCLPACRPPPSLSLSPQWK